MPFQSYILLLITLVNLAFMVLLLASSRKEVDHRFFIAAIFFNVWWSIGDSLFIGSSNSTTVRFGAQLFFVSPLLTAYSLLVFSILYKSTRTKIAMLASILLLPAIAFSVVIMQDVSSILQEVTLGGRLNSFIVNRSFYIVYILYFSVFFGASYVALYRRSTKQEGIERRQTRAILYAAVTSSFFAMMTNLSLPLIGKTDLIWLGPVFTILYVYIVSRAIISQKLFDVRLAAARASGYIFSLLFLILCYGGGVYVLGEKIFGDQEISRTVERFIFVMFAIFTAAVFAPLKKVFDRITNFIFYRDSYNSQDLLNEFNQLLAVTADVDTLLGSAARIIQKHLKSEYVVFGLRETERMPRRLVGTIKKSYKEEDLSELRRLTVHMSNSIIIRELLDKNDSAQAGISKILKKYSIELLARLVDRRDTKQQSSGYLLLGPKKSGNKYTSQDAEVFEIIVNEMVLAIQNALRFEEIEQFNETLQEKIFTATRELKQSNDKLRALDQAKDEFVSMASHQLRTPLTSVKGYLSMLAEGDAGKLNPTQQQFVEQSFASSQRMVYLISDLLNVSRLKTGKFVIEKIPTNLAKLIDEELSQLKGAFDAKHLKLATSLPEDFPTIELDETKIRQVVMNFVDNAIYYTPDGGNVDIKLVVTNRKIEFTVTDSGIGVPKHVQHHLFTKFYRADNARKMRPDGTGIGLFMAKKVITAQGGSIIFRSSEGKGSTFGFSFPVV
jgi:signal transduction histidine kinase